MRARTLNGLIFKARYAASHFPGDPDEDVMRLPRIFFRRAARSRPGGGRVIGGAGVNATIWG